MIPFTFHCNNGEDPPFTGLAVKVTVVPGQTEFEVAVMLMSTTGPAMTHILNWTGVDAAQPVVSV